MYRYVQEADQADERKLPEQEDAFLVTACDRRVFQELLARGVSLHCLESFQRLPDIEEKPIASQLLPEV